MQHQAEALPLLSLQRATVPMARLLTVQSQLQLSISFSDDLIHVLFQLHLCKILLMGFPSRNATQEGESTPQLAGNFTAVLLIKGRLLTPVPKSCPVASRAKQQDLTWYRTAHRCRVQPALLIATALESMPIRKQCCMTAVLLTCLSAPWGVLNQR